MPDGSAERRQTQPTNQVANAANASGPANNNMWLGRPWGWQQAGGDASTVLINTKMDDSVRAAGWLNWNANELNAGNGKNDGDPKREDEYLERLDGLVKESVGLRLISYDRPGYGGSTPQPGRSVADCAADVRMYLPSTP